MQILQAFRSGRLTVRTLKHVRNNGSMPFYEPVSSSYFTGKEGFYDDFLKVENILKRCQTFPTISFEKAPSRLWKTLDQYKANREELAYVKASEYRTITQMLNRINRIDPMFMPQDAKEIINAYSRKPSDKYFEKHSLSLDNLGRSRTIGRRKEAVSRVWMIKGDGQILVNGKSLFEAFYRVCDRESLIFPLKITHRLSQYNIWILVDGGGSTGQSQASALAISRGLIIHEPELRPLLRKMSCLTCDSRRVERKKPGQPKARKKNAWKSFLTYFRTIPLLILAKANNLNIELITEHPAHGLSKEYLSNFPKGKIPGFKGIDDFILSETNAISIYFASQNEKTTLLGKTKKEYALILQWISFANTDLITSLANWVHPLTGRSAYVKKTVDHNQAETERLCKYVDDFLLERTFLVGERLTLADIVMAAHLTPGFSNVFGKEWRLRFQNLVRWFVTVTNQPIWTAAVEVPNLIEEPIKYVPQKAQKTPSVKHAATPEASLEAEESCVEKKPKHPLDSAPTGTFVLDEWKRQYSNNDPSVAMKWFWENLDADVYSLWKVDYKYNDELGLVFQSSNLCGGFFQRLDASRKYIFGNLIVYGVNHDSIISGVFVIRGKDFKQAFDVAPDWESYDFTLLDHTKEEDKKLVESFWNKKDPIKIEDKTYAVASEKFYNNVQK
ncbi:hypothetical protein PORY_002329 [Pneumocystis oryctolagi]|uniref:Uncharacterized protein n=1 Tax=Pneumocystis oryctolagi TaxID=42067 RepID=A0ACB7CGY2_9ASCO|nr:hypothetical protein PORY_002329 [Pneumocystis oryctolagi]